MKYENHFGTDTLLALLLLRFVLSSEQEPTPIKAIEKNKLGDWLELYARKNALMWDVLWGDVSFGGSIKHEKYRADHVPLEYILHLCSQHKELGAIQCKLRLVDQDAKLYMETSEFHAQTEPVKEQFEHLKKEDVLIMPLSDCCELAIDLVRGRQEILINAQQELGGRTIELEEWRARYRPIELDLMPMKKPLRWLIKTAIVSRVSEFENDQLLSEGNVLRWAKQKEKMTRFLKPLQRDCVEIWFSYQELKGFGLPDSIRPVETLLVMENRGDIVIQDIKASGNGDIKFKIDAANLFGKKSMDIDKNVKEDWVKCGDFEMLRKPLSLRIGDMPAYSEENENAKAVNEDIERRKTLRVLNLFVPWDGCRRSYPNLIIIAKSLGVKTRAAKSHISIARKFLRNMGSNWTISDGRNGEYRMEEREKVAPSRKTKVA